MRSRSLPSLLLATAAIAAAGCGSGSDDSSGEAQQNQAGAGSAQVSANDVAEVIGVRQAITRACDEGGDRSELKPAIDLVVGIVREGPSDRFESGQTDTPQTMSSVADDLAQALDKCNEPQLAEELRNAATGLKPVQKGTPGY